MPFQILIKLYILYLIQSQIIIQALVVCGPIIATSSTHCCYLLNIHGSPFHRDIGQYAHVWINTYLCTELRPS
jgi:hypothetical protein